MIKYIITAFLLLVSFPLFSQWLPANGPDGGRVRCFGANNNSVFAGTYYGIFSSTNNGANWRLSSKGLTNSYIYFIAAKGDTLLAGIPDGLFVSTDYGNNWSQKYFDGSAVTSAVFQGNRLYIWYAGRFAYTDNFGANWTVRYSPAEVTTCACIIDSTVFFGNYAQYVYRSTNMGITWDSLISGIPYGNPTDMEVIGNNIYLCARYLYRSSDHGNTWTEVLNTGSYVNDVCYDGTAILAGTNLGMMVSTNNGVNWSMRFLGGGTPTVTAVISNGSKVFAGADYSSIYVSSNHGTNWALSNTGYSNLVVTSLISADSSLFAATTQKGVFRSNDNGNSWMQVVTPSIISVNVLKYLNGKLYMGFPNGTGYSCIYTSTNYGVNWVLLGLTGKNVNDIFFKDSLMFAGTTTGLYRSSDGGTNWVASGLTTQNVNRIAEKSGTLFAGCQQGFYYSTNNGVTWIQTDIHMNNDIIVSGNNIYAGHIDDIYKSSNNGVNWSPVNSGGLYTNGFFASGNTVFALTRTGVFSTSDGGQNWISRNEGLVFPDSKCIVTKGGYAYLGTKGLSVFKRPVNEIIGIRNLSSEIPPDYILYNNYPNPFNPVTKIKFDVPLRRGSKGTENVVLVVYNILGKTLQTLVNEPLPPGAYEVTFDGSALPSGVYYYRLLAGGEFRNSRKMVLMK